MNNSHIRIENILIFALYLAVLFALWQTFKKSIKKFRKPVKRRLPRKSKPRSPQDCPDCQSGVKLAVLKPKTDVIPYAQRKSTRGRTKQLETQGHACPNPKCDYCGVSDHLLHAVVGDGKRGVDKHIQYWKCHMVAPRCGE